MGNISVLAPVIQLHPEFWPGMVHLISVIHNQNTEISTACLSNMANIAQIHNSRWDTIVASLEEKKYVGGIINILYRLSRMLDKYPERWSDIFEIVEISNMRSYKILNSLPLLSTMMDAHPERWSDVLSIAK